MQMKGDAAGRKERSVEMGEDYLKKAKKRRKADNIGMNNGGKHRRGYRGKRGDKKTAIIAGSVIAAVAACAAGGVIIWNVLGSRPVAEDTVREYFDRLNQGDYAGMYALLSDDSKKQYTEEAFVERNQNIYEGIEASDLKITLAEGETGNKGVTRKETETVAYGTSMETAAGSLEFDNQMTLIKNDSGEYGIQWDSTLIFPSLQDEYRVSVKTLPAQRGSIYDRNGTVIAEQGIVSEVGLVPGKMSQDPAADIQKLAEILGITAGDINTELSASWVQDDSFVPLKQIAKDDTAKEEQLLQIPGVLINDAEARVYPLGAAAGHLTGYVQAITAEELEEKREEGYHAGSVIGKTGLEAAFEEELRAKDGVKIEIIDDLGSINETLISREPQNGQDIQVTIDASLQQTAYEQFRDERGAVAAMNPVTGEVLALVSAPGYDPNEFILGITDARWEELNDPENMPLQSRFQSTWVPGSTFKGITAAIGVDNGKIDPSANMGYVGLSWQKDESWGDYHVTTLTDYGENVTLENALVYSDNIYFARAALDIGAETMAGYFKKMGFDEEIPFELSLQQSTYDDDGNIDSDIQMADTGYGQGQLLVNPVHMLAMYSMFVNGGDMIQPTLVWEDGYTAKVWKEQAVSAETAETVKNALIQVIENPSGTGAAAKIDGITMLGKTGTAEIKESQDDTAGIERGWFICETADPAAVKPVAVVGMIEDVKGRGGSNYVTEKVANIAAAYEQK